MDRQIIDASRRRMVMIAGKYRRFTTRSAALLRHIALGLNILTFVASVGCLVGLAILVGFEHDSAHAALLHRLMRIVQAVFLTNVLFNLIFRFRATVKSTRVIKWLVDIGILLTLLPLIYPHPDNPWLPWLEQLLYSHRFQYIAMSAYAAVDVCYGTMVLLGRRTNPALLLAGSFVFFIFVGTLVLMMPRCTVDGSLSFVDSLFVSTSAVCITGLTTVNIATTFTPLGQTVLAVLFQIGGLGIITFTSFFAIFFSGRQSIYSQLLVKDLVYSKTVNALVPTLLYILAFTIAIEAVGALVIFYTLPDGLACSDGISRWGLAVFHSMSAFCNVGFSNLPDGMATPVLMHGNQTIYIAMSVLLFAGGVGFPILVNFRDTAWRGIKRLANKILGRDEPRKRHPHAYDLNTKLVLTTTLGILIVASTAFFMLESSNTMRGMSVYERVVQSVFNSLIPRSGGYATVNPANFLNVTLLLVMIQMWIGGASQSMAGGVKVNTVAVAALGVRAVVEGHRGATAYGRKIDTQSVRRAASVICLSLASMAILLVVLLLLEPEMSPKAVLFEGVSALFSVGSSLGITPELSTPSKWVVCAAMFVGRVGLVSLLTGLFVTRRDPSTHFPSESVIIN